MSRYRDGMRRLNDRVGGPWIATPGYIKNEVTRLDVEMNAFDADARNKLATLFNVWLGEIGPDAVEKLKQELDYARWADKTFTFAVLRFYPANPLYPLYNFIAKIWGPLFDEWVVFVKNHDDWHENMWGSTVSTIESYRSQLNKMRERYNGLLSQFDEELDSPDPVKGPDWEGAGLLKGAGALLKTVIIGGAILVGGIFGIKALQGLQGGGGGSSLPRLPPASASERPRPKTKADSQIDRVADAMARKAKS